MRDEICDQKEREDHNNHIIFIILPYNPSLVGERDEISKSILLIRKM